MKFCCIYISFACRFMSALGNNRSHQQFTPPDPLFRLLPSYTLLPPLLLPSYSLNRSTAFFLIFTFDCLTLIEKIYKLSSKCFFDTIGKKNMITDHLKKNCVWEYDINFPLEKISGSIKAQRYAAFWPYFHEAFKQKELNLDDIKSIIQVILKI